MFCRILYDLLFYGFSIEDFSLVFQDPTKTLPGWWFQIFFMFIPMWGFMIQFDWSTSKPIKGSSVMECHKRFAGFVRVFEHVPIRSMYGIFTNIWLILKVNVGEYTSPMDPMGFGTPRPTWISHVAWFQTTHFQAVGLQLQVAHSATKSGGCRERLRIKTPVCWDRGWNVLPSYTQLYN